METTTIRSDEKGTILVMALVAAVLIVGFTYAFLVVSRSEIEGAKADVRREQALQAAEAGIEDTLDRINNGKYQGVERTDERGLSYSTKALDSGSTAGGRRVFTLTSHSTVAGMDRAVEVVVENQTLAVRTRGAVTSDGPVTLSGSVSVDGRDYDADGFGLVGPGVFGVTTSQLVTTNGSSSIGGNGQAPINDPAVLDNVFEQGLLFGDGIDLDVDGRMDEELLDGADNDGDGLVDEDLAAYPKSPDALFGVPDGTLKRYAIAQGTYFANQSDFDAYLSQNGNEVPGGKVIVLDFPASASSGPTWNPVDFGPEYNEEPSIIVFHTEFANAVMKNLHGRFKGFILTDYVSHVNGDARILGAIYSFGHDQIGSLFGNGNAQILYSSAVLSRLPMVPFFAPRAWREVAVGAVSGSQ